MLGVYIGAGLMKDGEIKTPLLIVTPDGKILVGTKEDHVDDHDSKDDELVIKHDDDLKDIRKK